MRHQMPSTVCPAARYRLRRFSTLLIVLLSLAVLSRQQPTSQAARSDNQRVLAPGELSGFKPQEAQSGRDIFAPLTDHTLNQLAAQQFAGSSRSAATAQTFARLLAKAQVSGPVRVIVGLRATFQPEGALGAPTAVRTQRSAIRQAQTALLDRLAAYQVAGVKRFESIPFLALEADAIALQQLEAAPEVTSLQEDRAVPPALAESASLVGAPAAWASGFTGAGQTVAILDTGVDKQHPFLAGKVVSEACYSTTNSVATSVCPGGVAQSISAGSGVNCNLSIAGCAHGTHVAGIAAGKGNNFSGVAKDANIIAIQVFSRFNNQNDCDDDPAPCVRTYDSDYIRGLERVQALSSSFKIAAANMSLGGGKFTANCDADEAATKATIDNLRSLGIATVISSGNSSYTNALGSPACISSAISVGSTGDGSRGAVRDAVASSSNSASFLHLLAPGRFINSSVPGGSFENLSGTSMAAPHVAGAWAVLKSKAPSAAVAQVLAALTSSGVPITDARNGITKPRLQLAAALQALSGNNEQAVELKADDGESETYFTPRDGLAVINRLTPPSYPAKLVKIRLAFSQIPGQPSPVGKPFRVIFAPSPANSTQPPPASQFTVVNTTVTNLGAVDIDISNGPTIDSGDFYVGGQAPAPHGGVTLLVDLNSQAQNRSFLSTDNGNTWQGPLSPPSGASSANALIRAVVSIGSGSNCTFTLSAPGQNFPASGGNGSVNVTTQSGCNWTAMKTDTWITINSSSSGNGNGQVSYSVSPNTNAGQRNGTLTIADQTYAVTQAGTGGGGGTTEELSADDGSFEQGASGPGIYLLNRLTPTKFPATLRKIRIYYNLRPNGVPNPTGTQLRLLAFTAPAGQSPNRPNFTFDQMLIFPTAPPNGDFVDFDIPNGPTVNAGQDLFVGFQTPTVPLAVFGDANGPQQNRSYISSDGQSFGNIFFTDQQGNRTPVNLMIRAVVSAATSMGNPTINVQPPSLEFNSVNVGAQNSRQFTISNTGTANLEVRGISSNDPQFTSGINCNPCVVQPGNQVEGAIFFRPTSAGVQQGRLTITSNDPARSTVTVQLRGEGGSTQSTCPSITDFNPKTGPVGTAITITGTNFTGVTQVRFGGGVSASPTVNAAGTEIRVNVPAGAQSGPLTLVKAGCADTPTTSFTVTTTSNTPRVVSIGNTGGAPGTEVRVPISIAAQGDEFGVQFSLSFNPAVLSFVRAEPGLDATNNQFFDQNQTQLNQGQMGVILLLRNALAQGTRQLAVVTFRLSANANGQTQVSFADAPTRQRVIDANSNLLTASFAGVGVVTAAQGFEGDVNNDNEVDIIDARLIILHLRDVPNGPGVIQAGAAFQRADCAPRADRGDGVIDIGDARQVILYAAGRKEDYQPAGGPSAPQNLAAEAVALKNFYVRQQAEPRRLRLATEQTAEGSFVQVLLDAQGGESALSFSLNFDPQRVRFNGVAAGEEVGAATFLVNTQELKQGRVGLALLLPPGETFTPGVRRVAKLSFDVLAEEADLSHTLWFGDAPLARQVIDEQANPLGAEFVAARLPLARDGLVLLSATDYSFASLAADDAVAAFGAELAAITQTATEPSIVLAGVTVRVRDSQGVERFAPLLFVEPQQVNFLIPTGTAAGPAIITLSRNDGRATTGVLHVVAKIEQPR